MTTEPAGSGGREEPAGSGGTEEPELPHERTGAAGMAYRARALAQAHPLTALARRYLDAMVARERTSQPVPEIGIWAGAALLNGYCLRRVEEEENGVHLEPSPEPESFPELEDLDRIAVDVAADLRTEGAGGHILGDEDMVVEALDDLVFSDVQRRLDHWRESIDDKAWDELTEYLTWWVVKGYALRVAETLTGALA